MALPSFLCPRTILGLNDQMTRVPPNQRTRSISPFGLREFQFSNSLFSQSISPRVHDPTTRVPLRSMVEISFGSPDFRDFNSQPLLLRTLLAGVHRFLPCVLLESTVLVHFGTSTISNLSPSHFPRDDNLLTLFNPTTILHSGTSAFDNLKPFSFTFSQRSFTRVHDPLTRILLHDQRSRIHPK
jgi:hypothetical protein